MRLSNIETLVLCVVDIIAMIMVLSGRFFVCSFFAFFPFSKANFSILFYANDFMSGGVYEVHHVNIYLHFLHLKRVYLNAGSYSLILKWQFYCHINFVGNTQLFIY